MNARFLVLFLLRHRVLPKKLPCQKQHQKRKDGKNQQIRVFLTEHGACIQSQRTGRNENAQFPAAAPAGKIRFHYRHAAAHMKQRISQAQHCRMREGASGGQGNAEGSADRG